LASGGFILIFLGATGGRNFTGRAAPPVPPLGIAPALQNAIESDVGQTY